MSWSQGRNDTVCLYLILLDEISDVVTTAKMFHVTVLTIIWLIVKNASDKSTTVLIGLYKRRQMLCSGPRVTHIQKVFIALFFYIFHLQYSECIASQEGGIS